MRVQNDAGDVTFVMAYAHPTLGMERAALSLLRLLARERRVRVVVAGGPAPALEGVDATSLGDAPRRFGMLVRWWRLQRARKVVAGSSAVVLVGAWIAVPALLIPRWTRSPIVVWEHSLMREQLRTTFARRVLWRLARRLYSRATRIVAVSAPLGDDLTERFGVERVQVIPNVVEASDAGACRAGGGAALRRLVSVGSLTANKRHDWAVSAVAGLPGATLDIYGEGPQRPYLQRLIDASGAQARIRLHGYLPHDEVLAAMRACDALVHPSAGETFGLVFVEAANLGIPVLAAANRVSSWMIPTYVPGRTFESRQELEELLRQDVGVSPGEVQDARQARLVDFDPAAVEGAWSDLLTGVTVGGRHV